MIRYKSNPTTVEKAEDISEGRKISKGFTLPKDCLIDTTVVGKICKLVDAKMNKRQAPSWLLL